MSDQPNSGSHFEASVRRGWWRTSLTPTAGHRRRLTRESLGSKDATTVRTSQATAFVLAGLSALHIAWGLGSSFPFRDPATLADAVAGTRAVPKPRDCFAVAGLLLTSAALVGGARPLQADVRRVGALGVATILGGRGILGIAKRTATVVPWAPSDRFVRLDQRYYGPLCLALAAGAAISATTTQQ